jgi:hypothetical protein
MPASRPPRIYFHNCEEPDNLQDDIVCLAEGLTALGIEYFARADYWLRSTEPGDYLLRQSEGVHPSDCDIVVFPYTWANWVRVDAPPVRRPLPKELLRPGRSWLSIYMDTNDGYRTVAFEEEFRAFDAILRTKLNRRCFQPSNFRPWQLGLSNRMIRATESALPFAQRRQAILWNFGASHPFPHGAREAARRIFQPEIAQLLPLDATKDDLSQEPPDADDRLMWFQTNRRHSRAYYERLKSTVACAAFCGDLAPPFPFNPSGLLAGGNRAKIRRAFYGALAKFSRRPERIIQWDSWRFWESLAAGCVPINIDLELYGVALPVMPENWRHYVGVDLRRPRETVERLRDEPELLGRISRDGRKWVLMHYAPKAVAERFLDMFAPDWRGAPSEASPSETASLRAPD